MSEAEYAALPALYAPSYQYLYKMQSWDGASVAVLLMNHDKGAQDLSLDFADVPGLACSNDVPCTVRDLWARKGLGTFHGSFTAKAVASHDCAFLLVKQA